MSFSKPRFEIADIIRNYRLPLEDKGYLNAHKKRVFTNLSQCRTAALGYHIDICDNSDCEHTHISFNSCRDRHCPKCNGMKREKWIRMRQEDMLPQKYYHVVFTIPDRLNDMFLEHPVNCYNLLFRSAWETIEKFGANHKFLGAKMGMTAILHTWGQNLSFHPHIHCIVPAGGITKSRKWKTTRNNGKFLFPVKSLSKVFRGIFTDGLMALDKKAQVNLEPKFDKNKKYLHPLYNKNWVVYAKRPMNNASQVVEYTGRYSHRIAISNHRIKKVHDGKVDFSWLDYRTSKTEVMELSANEFLRRFSMHILPAGYMKIRHYGILSSRCKSEALACIREQLGVEAPPSIKGLPWQNLFELFYGRQVLSCPVCKQGKLIIVVAKLPKSRGSPTTLELPVNKSFYLQN